MKKVNIQSDIDSRKAIEHHGGFSVTFLGKSKNAQPITKASEPIIEIVEPITEIENGNSEKIQRSTDNQASSRSKKSKTKRRETERDT